MKKNVIMIVVDSVIYKKMGEQEYGINTTPFLESIKDKCLFTTNMYAQGPFTESGNKALLTGDDSLSNGGYMHNLNQSKDIYIDVFKKEGYEIFDMFSPYYMYSNKHFDMIDNQFFTTDFQFLSVWEQRLKYFIELQNERPLNAKEYGDIFYQMELTFEAWLNLLNYEGNENKYLFIERICQDYDFKKNHDLLLHEQSLFSIDKQKYVDNLLLLKYDHSIFKIDSMGDHKFIDPEFIAKNVYGKYEKFFRKLKWKQFCLNLKNNKISLPRLLSSIRDLIKTKKLDGYFKQFLFILFSAKISDNYTKRDFFKYMPSMRRFMNLTHELILNRISNSKPFFVHLHVDDLHNRTSFFSYDTDDVNVVDREFTAFQKYLNCLKRNYKGQIVYDLALLYVDDCIQGLFKKLESNNLLDNTIVAITADHGCSYDCTPLRNRFVNNYHSENYHIPFIVYDKSVKSRGLDYFYTSKDVLPTLYDLCNIGKIDSIAGSSILQNDYKPRYALSEYMGGGCPDMRLRPIHYIIRDSQYLVAYQVKLTENFENGEIVELYNLMHDPTEESNLVNSSHETKSAGYLLSKIEMRHKQLQYEN